MMIYSKDYIKATTIEERVDVLKNYNNVYINFEEYSNWVNIRGVVKESDIINYFRTENIDPEQIAKVVSLEGEEEKKLLANYVEKTEWYKTYVDIIGKYEQKKTEININEADIDLGMFVLPFVMYAGDELNNKIKKVKRIEISENVLKRMLEKITNVLVNLGIKTFVWEFRNSTHNSDISSEEKNKKDNDVLIREYLQKLYDTEEIVLLYSKYPVIMRRVVTKTQQLVKNFTTLIERVEKDYYEINDILGEQIHQWIDINADQGDTHEKGSFVSRLRFDCGNVIYKPRNLKIQQKFYEFIDYIAKNSDNILETTNSCSKYHDDYTWDGFIENKECKDLNEVKRYYIRFGQMCAFVFLLRGNDIHYENIIANGEFPVIIDIETLFQNLSDTVLYQDNAASAVYKSCIDSVGGTAMVPIVAFSKKEEGKGIDISALGGKGQELPYKLLQLVCENTDEIHFEKKTARMEDANNLPRYKSKEVDFHDYTNEIVYGFNNVMKYILVNKKVLIENDVGALNMFKGIEERHLMRATQNYAKMMSFSSHPNYNEDIIYMQRMLINIWTYPYVDKSIVKYEVEDILFGDIPIFFGKTDSVDILSANRDKICGYFDKSMFEKVKIRINGLTDDEIEKQISQMKICMGLYASENIQKKNLCVCNNTNIIKKNILGYVECIADKIVENAEIHNSSNTVEWNNVFFDNVNKCWKTRGIGCGMVNGASGVLSFVYLTNKYIGKYDSFIDTMINSIVNMPNEKLPMVLSDGISANIYVLLMMYQDSKEEKYKKIIYYLLGIIRKNMNMCVNKSLMYGLAGVALVVSEAWLLFEDSEIKNILCDLVEKIISTDEQFVEDSFYSGKLGCAYCLKSILDKGFDIHVPEIYKFINDNCKVVEEHKDYYLVSEEINRLIIEKNDNKYISFSGGMSAELYKKIIDEEKEEVSQIVMEIIDNIEKDNMYFPSIKGYETVGFMYGLAGIGYSLLKSCYPEIADIPVFSL